MDEETTEQYYLSAFKKLEDSGKNTWNWAAFFGGELWLLYRKMHMFCVLYILPQLFVWKILNNILCDDNGLEKQHLLLAIQVLWCVFYHALLGMFGNKIYYYQVKKNIKTGYHKCSEYGATSSVLFGICVLLWILAVLFCIISITDSNRCDYCCRDDVFLPFIIPLCSVILLIPIFIVSWIRDRRLLRDAMKRCNPPFDDELSEKNIRAVI